jgi:uncharacterized protein YjbI with pentapeptide repeats
MFTSIHLLPQNTGDHWKFKERWDSDVGRDLHDMILKKIRRGGGEDFLQSDFEAGRLGFLEDKRDLRGFKFFQETIVFPTADNFEAIDFSHAEFWHCDFTNGFFSCRMAFTKFYNCTFTKCIFSFNHCYAAMFENVRFIDCDFLEHDTFTNCSFSGTLFQNTFFPANVFYDCLFDSTTQLQPLIEKPVRHKSDSVRLHDTDKSDLLRSIGEAYLSGHASNIARTYQFQHLQCLTRYNTKHVPDKLGGLLFEYLSGYGLRPWRVIASMFTYFAIALFAFASQVGFLDAILLTSGALFTFGAKTYLLDNLSLWFRALYILSSFVGISLTALFITVLVNVFSSNK